MKCFVLCSGSYAMALASVLERKGYQVALWCRREERAQDDLKTGVSRPPMLRAEVGPEAAVVPSQGASDFPVGPLRNDFEALYKELARHGNPHWASTEASPILP